MAWASRTAGRGQTKTLGTQLRTRGAPEQWEKMEEKQVKIISEQWSEPWFGWVMYGGMNNYPVLYRFFCPKPLKRIPINQPRFHGSCHKGFVHCSSEMMKWNPFCWGNQTWCKCWWSFWGSSLYKHVLFGLVLYSDPRKIWKDVWSLKNIGKIDWLIPKLVSIISHGLNTWWTQTLLILGRKK